MLACKLESIEEIEHFGRQKLCQLVNRSRAYRCLASKRYRLNVQSCVSLERMASATAKDTRDPTFAARNRIAEQSRQLARNDGQPGGKAGEIIADLAARLAAGELGFGQTLSIKALADEYQASRQPVSAAISHLRSLGYVVVIPQVGCRIVSPSANDIQDFFHVLARVESSYAGLAAARYVDDEAKILVALADEVAAYAFDDVAQRLPYAAAVDAFHEMIWEMSRASAVFPRTRDLWQLADFYLWQGAENFDAGKVDAANKERRQIARAIERREVEKAENLVEKHVRGKPRRVGIV
ncbi:MAG: GntR family transcriptional regulator [Pseudomonadota bacterium]